MKRVIASIVAYHNDRDMLLGAINSFLSSAGDTTLMLIDHSKDDSLRTLTSDHRVVYQYSKANRGFGAGHNIAMRTSLEGADYHLVLDPDVHFGVEVIPELIRFMDDHPVVGLVMPRVLYPDGTPQWLCRLLPSPGILFVRRFLQFMKPLLRQINVRYELQEADPEHIQDVPFLSGCFMFFRNSALATVGLFDERFFLYSEDIDISRRVHQQFRTVYYPFVSIFHVFGKAPYRNWSALRSNIRSAFAYFNKWGWFNDPERKRINRRTLEQLIRKG